MSNTRSFTDFDSPDSGTALSTTEAGVLLTDTLEDFREKTNGIIEKVNTIVAGGLTDNTVALTKIVEIADNTLLGNVSGGTANVSEIEIDVTASGLQDSDDTIPSSKAVKEYVDTAISTKLDSSTFTAFEATAATTHYIDAYGGGATNLDAGSITTAQSDFIAAAMTGVVATGHFVMARVNQYYSTWTGNGTTYDNRQMFVVLSVTSLDGDGKPTFNAVATGHV